MNLIQIQHDHNISRFTENITFIESNLLILKAIFILSSLLVRFKIFEYYTVNYSLDQMEPTQEVFKGRRTNLGVGEILYLAHMAG